MNEEISIFEFLYPTYKITKPIRLIELFGGIGSQAKALKRLGANFEHYRLVEFDKYAIMSYNAIHDTNFQTSDIRDIHANDLGIVDTSNYEYIMTYSFPCQDLSIAGKRKGMKKGTGTRSGLLWQVERLLDECDELPQILLMENVPEVIGAKNINDFKVWQLKLEQLGYINYVKILNAKDYEIPQNRNRCFMISILGKYNYTFPAKKPLKLRLKDLLEENVDEKYYLSKEIQDRFKITDETMTKYIIGTTAPNFRTIGQRDLVYQPNGVMGALVATDYKQPKQIIQIGSVYIGNNESNNHVYSTNGLSPTLNTMQGGHRQPKILVKEATKRGYAEAEVGDSINLEQPNSKTRRGRVGKGVAQTLTTSCNQAVIEPLICASRGRKSENLGTIKDGETTEQRIEINYSGCSNTLTTVQKDNYVLEPNFDELLEGTNYARNFGSKGKVQKEDGICSTLQAAMGSGGGNIPLAYTRYRIRKLTPRECWRLMGFDNEDIEKAQKVNSNSQLYKQAGNSIVVNVLEAIFKQLF